MCTEPVARGSAPFWRRIGLGLFFLSGISGLLFRVPPENRLEELKGTARGSTASGSTTNGESDSCGVIGDAFDVEITDYH